MIHDTEPISAAFPQPLRHRCACLKALMIHTRISSHDSTRAISHHAFESASSLIHRANIQQAVLKIAW